MLQRFFQRFRQPMTDYRTIFSFVVDAHPKFAYQGYHLAMSLLEHCGASPQDIHVQITPEVGERTRKLFANLGFRLHEIQPFGDGRYCNKCVQLQSLTDLEFDQVILLDTDTIFVADPRPMLARGVVQGKVVDAENPSLHALEEIARNAGMRTLPPRIMTENGASWTYLGNCNGGFYLIPRRHVETISTEWQRWALWLRENIEPLRREGKEMHADQVSMWLTIHMAGVPFAPAPSNVNHYIHFSGKHINYDPSQPITMLHYHDMSMNAVGMIEPRSDVASVQTPVEQAAIAQANTQMSRQYNNCTFWDLRYALFPERGSGLGSRDSNLLYKRELLSREGIENAESILDVGCGDLEVLKAFDLRGYLGIDQSEAALSIARQARPDLNFRAIDLARDFDSIPPKELVLCFEVLIHQETKDTYRQLIEFLAAKTVKTLLVSGYDTEASHHATNHMIFFHEPVSESLRATRRFRSIEKIGAHSDVGVFKCSV